MRHVPYQRKLTPAECRQARALVASGRSLRDVASHFQVSRMAIWRLLQDDTSVGRMATEQEKPGGAWLSYGFRVGHCSLPAHKGP